MDIWYLNFKGVLGERESMHLLPLEKKMVSFFRLFK